MSKRKTRLEKIRLGKMRIKQKNELLRLERQVRDIEEKLILTKKQNNQNMCIKNLKIFSGVGRKLLPYVLVGCLSVGGIKLIGLGFPFKKDIVTATKYYSVESNLDGQITAHETYKHLLTNSNKLVLYFPWKLGTDGLYHRKVREYSSSILSDLKMYEAVLNNDISYIKDKAQYNELIETSNYVNLYSDENEYLIDAYITVKSPNETISYIESNEINNLNMILNAIITLVLGAVINRKRSFRLRYYIKDLNQIYEITDLKPLEKELEIAKTKVLSLKKGDSML